jgi:hypothetical protein
VKLRQVKHVFKQHAPSILSGLAISGTITSLYLGVRAGYRIGYDEGVNSEYRTENDPFTNKERLERHWKELAPPAVTAVSTVACIVGASHISLRRGVAAQAAFVLTERAYQEYRDRVVHEFGEKKDQEIQDEMREDRVKSNPPATSPVIVIDSDSTMCCELYSGRYFLCDIERLRRLENELNSRLLKHDQVTLEEWYDMLGIPSTSIACDLGWTSDRLMGLEFTSILAESGRPVLAFDYNYVRPLYQGVFE